MRLPNTSRYLLASDFDQTLSCNDSGVVLAEMLGIEDYQNRVDGLGRSNLVQPGGELAYLIRHDPDFRNVRREHLLEAGRRVRLKEAIPAFMALMESDALGHRVSFFVISAAPREVVLSALDGVVTPDRIFATELDWETGNGEVRAIRHVAAGFGKAAIIDALAAQLDIASDRVVYVGDGRSDIHAMLHVNNGNGFTISVSENRHLARIAKSTVLSDNALSIAVPVLEVLGWCRARIRREIETRDPILAGGWAEGPHRSRNDLALLQEGSR